MSNACSETAANRAFVRNSRFALGERQSAFSPDDLRGGLHLAAGDAHLVEELEFPPELGSGNLSFQELRIARNGSENLVRTFAHELNPEGPRAE